jgi:hypothetical protein
VTKKKSVQLAIWLSLLVACRTAPPKGPVCVLFTDNSKELVCATTDNPNETFIVPTNAISENYICRPQWYEQSMIEWIQRELAKRR